jgi:hypothetical protein
MKKTPIFPVVLAVLLCSAVSSAGGLEIDGTFQLGNIGFTADRKSTEDTFAGSDYFWGGSLFLSQNLSGSMQIDAALNRDLIMGNSLSALFQYKTDYFRLGMGPYLGLLNPSSTILKSGLSTLLRAELPGVAFVSWRLDSSLGGQSSRKGDYFAQSNEILLGFYVRDSAICAFGLTYKQLDSNPDATPLEDSQTVYSFDVKVFEKNIPYRLDFNIAYQVLQKQYLDGAAEPLHGLDSLIVGAGIDIILTGEFALTFGLRTSVYTIGADVLSGVKDIGFAPFLFQGSVGFRISLPDQEAPASQS